MVAFLALERSDCPTLDGVSPLAEALHSARAAQGTPATPEDSYFTVLLVAFALFGDAIAGSLFRGETEGNEDLASRERFRVWLARLVQTHIEAGRSDPR